MTRKKGREKRKRKRKGRKRGNDDGVRKVVVENGSVPRMVKCHSNMSSGRGEARKVAGGEF